MKAAGIPGYFTNHSLCATTTTWLYEAQVDEATIMERTGSTGGVWVYKRSSDELKKLSSNVLNQGLMNKKTKMEDSETEDKVSVNPSGTVSGQPKMDTDTDAKVSSGTMPAQPVMVPKMDVQVI